MQVTLFKALQSIDMPQDAAEKVVHAFEEHIDMAVTDAMKHYDGRLTAMQTVFEAKLESGLKGIEGKLTGMQTSIDALKWTIIIQSGLVALATLAAGLVKALH